MAALISSTSNPSTFNKNPSISNHSDVNQIQAKAFIALGLLKNYFSLSPFQALCNKELLKKAQMIIRDAKKYHQHFTLIDFPNQPQMYIDLFEHLDMQLTNHGAYNHLQKLYLQRKELKDKMALASKNVVYYTGIVTSARYKYPSSLANQKSWMQYSKSINQKQKIVEKQIKEIENKLCKTFAIDNLKYCSREEIFKNIETIITLLRPTAG